MDYILPNEQEFKARVDTLPKSVRGVLDSEDTLFVVHQVARSFGLDEEQKIALEQLAGLVISGFIPAKDTAAIIEEEIGLEAEWSRLIAAELKDKIFAPIEIDLSRIATPQRDASLSKAAELQRERAAPISEARPGVGVVAPHPIPKAPELSQIAPSRIAPTVPLGTPLPIKIGPGTPAPLTPSRGELVEPFILHKEEAVRPITGEKSFKSFEASVPSAIKERVAPSISARLELGGENLAPDRKKEPVIAKTEVSAPRTVHYSNLRTPLMPESEEAKSSAPAPMPFSELPQPAPMTQLEARPSAGEKPLFPKMPTEPEPYLHPLPDLWPKVGSPPSAGSTPSISSAQASSPQAVRTEQAKPAEQKPAKIEVEEKKEPVVIITEPETPSTPSAPPQIIPKSTVNLDGNTVDLRNSNIQAPNTK